MSQTKAQEELNQWRGRIDNRVETLVNAVKGGNGEKGLVNEVSDIKLAIVGYKAKMAIFAAIGSFIGAIISSVLVAALIKYVFKLS